MKARRWAPLLKQGDVHGWNVTLPVLRVIAANFDAARPVPIETTSHWRNEQTGSHESGLGWIVGLRVVMGQLWGEVMPRDGESRNFADWLAFSPTVHIDRNDGVGAFLGPSLQGVFMSNDPHECAGRIADMRDDLTELLQQEVIVRQCAKALAESGNMYIEQAADWLLVHFKLWEPDAPQLRDGASSLGPTKENET
jgi:hypothetical protein